MCEKIFPMDAEERKQIMKKIKIMVLLCLVLVMLAGCGEKNAITGIPVGKWGYIHEPETPALVLKANGDAELDNVKYTYTLDADKIVLTAKDGTVTEMKYTAEGNDEMYIYKTARYNYWEEGTADSIIGLWNHESSAMSFEFTEDGTFQEDGYFPGYYTEDKENHTIKLVYNDHFEDTTLYYSIEDNKLILQYPWKMVRIK